jgi:hypothetical protein
VSTWRTLDATVSGKMSMNILMTTTFTVGD